MLTHAKPPEYFSSCNVDCSTRAIKSRIWDEALKGIAKYVSRTERKFIKKLWLIAYSLASRPKTKRCIPSFNFDYLIKRIMSSVITPID
jgi:hypothetical protein